MDYNANYRTVTQNHNGKSRRLNIPSPALKKLQKAQIPYLSNFPVSPYANAYIRYRSTKTALSPHLGHAYFVALDLEKFFHTITAAMIYDTLRGYHVPIQLCSEITALATFEGRLPFGGVTSPVISNIVFKKVDDAIAEFCCYISLTYTRYADDLYFSSNSQLTYSWVMAQIPNILYRHSFLLNHSKTRVNPPSVLGQSMSYPSSTTLFI